MTRRCADTQLWTRKIPRRKPKSWALNFFETTRKEYLKTSSCLKWDLKSSVVRKLFTQHIRKYYHKVTHGLFIHASRQDRCRWSVDSAVGPTSVDFNQIHHNRILAWINIYSKKTILNNRKSLFSQSYLKKYKKWIKMCALLHLKIKRMLPVTLKS